MGFFSSISPIKVPVETTPPTPTPIDPKIEYPHSVNIHYSYHSNFAEGIISKYCMVENIDYFKQRFSDHYHGSSTTFRFKDKQYVDEINKEIERINYVVNSIAQYEDEKLNDFYHHALHIAKEGRMNSSVNFIPRVDKMFVVTQDIISFYVNNGYNLPADTATFKAKYMTTDGQKFTVYLKNEEDAAQLLLQISDMIEIL